jgi:hypothetical protein
VSYDIYLLRNDVAGDDPARAYERLEELAEGAPRPPTPAEEEQLRQLAADLRAASPGLDLSEPDQGFLLQLGYESERPVVIDIGADEIRMSWSYGPTRLARRSPRWRSTSPSSSGMGTLRTTPSSSDCSHRSATPATPPRSIATSANRSSRSTADRQHHPVRGGSFCSAVRRSGATDSLGDAATDWLLSSSASCSSACPRQTARHGGAVSAASSLNGFESTAGGIGGTVLVLVEGASVGS